MTQVYCSGGPKSGTHALMKAVHLLGVPKDAIVHDHACLPAPDGCKQILIIRNPRDCVVSWLRRKITPKGMASLSASSYTKHLVRGVTTANLIHTIRPEKGEWWNHKTLGGDMYDYAQKIRKLKDTYIESDNLHVVAYEMLMDDTATELALIAIVGLGIDRLLFPFNLVNKLPGDTVTWTGEQRSSWKCDEWTDEVEEVWCKYRGPEVCELLGY